jgi:hypothetical protein
MTYGVVSARVGHPGTGWYSVSSGAGGFVSGIDVTLNAGGTSSQKLIRLDGGAAYRLNNSTGVWASLITTTSMPATDVGAGSHIYLDGQYEICAAPSDNTRVYMAYNASPLNGYVFVSNDSGTTWARTAGWPSSGVPWQSNDNAKYFGPKMAVDPANKDVVYIGTPPQSCTITVGSATVSCAGNGAPGSVHGLTTNTKIQFGNVGGALPTGVVAGTTYFVIATGLTTTAFQFSATQGGSAITPSGSTTGTNYVSRGALVTIDGGTTWTTVPNVTFAMPSTSGVAGISALGFAFDPTSGTQANTGGSGSKTTGIYLCSNGSGVWHSTDGGSTFALAGSPPDLNGNGVVGLDGVYYTVKLDKSQVWRWASSTWTNITPSIGSINYIVPSKFNAGTIIAVHDGGGLQLSNNNGTAWGGAVTTATTVSSDIPWLAVNNSFIAVDAAVMDPVTDGLIWFGSGIGPMYVQLTGSGASLSIPSPIQFTTKCQGVQELVNQMIISPPGGDIYTVNQDRPLFKISNPDSYPTTYYPTYAASNTGNPISFASDADWSSADPSYIAVLADVNREDAGFSTDAGTTWNRFTLNQNAVASTGAIGGSIAVGSSNFQIICQSNNGDVWYTTDGWATVNTRITAAVWNANGATGMQDANTPARSTVTGWGRAYYLRSKHVCADRIASNTFYILNSNSNATGGGIYKITFPAGVLTISRMGNVPPTDPTFDNNSRLLAVPNLSGTGSVSGHLWCISGEGNSTALWRSINGGASWTAVQNTGEIWCFGFGANNPGTDHPSVYAVGTINSVFGVYRGDNNIAVWNTNSAVVWTLLNTNLPLGSTDLPSAISGDSDQYGWCYIGYGSQLVYYRP